jgi:hypothetical protein
MQAFVCTLSGKNGSREDRDKEDWKHLEPSSHIL